MSQYYLPNQVKGVLIGGPGPTKENFIKANLFNYQINVIGPLFDVGYTDEAGIRAIVNKAEDVISEQESTVERQMIERFITEAVKNGLVAYGLKAVIDNIKMFKADSVLISEGLEYNIDVYNSDEGEQIRILKDGEEPKGKKVQLMDYLVELADEHNMEYHFISMETTEGAQFKSMFFGIGVFLRYK